MIENKLPDRLIVLLVLLQAILTVFIWMLGAQGDIENTTFVLLLGADLLAFATVAHVYRTEKKSYHGND